MWADQAHGKAYFNDICFNDILLKTVFTIILILLNIF